MASPTVPADIAGVGALGVPLLTAIGLDPAALVTGLIGCVIVQTLLPAAQPEGIKRIIALTLGSILFASLLTPVIAPGIIAKVIGYVPGAPPLALRALTSAVLGGFAQPLLIGMIALWKSKFHKGSKKGDDNAA
jgi:hypothetical protein